MLAEPTREIPSGQDEPIQPASLANQNVGSPSSCPLADGSFSYWAILTLRNDGFKESIASFTTSYEVAPETG